jgi:four helix bundle protein
MEVKSIEDLSAGREAHKLTLEMYKLIAGIPGTAKYGIVSQLRRSSSSVPANVAEGFGRATARESLRCLQIARGEREERRYFVLLSRDIGYVTSRDCDNVG